MEIEQFSELLAELNFILAKISKYLKNNQYVYLRAFNSWHDGYNSVAKQLNADKTISVPIFKLSPIDYSPTGKSIKMASVERFIQTISHQIVRLEDKLEEQANAAKEQPVSINPLVNFFHRTTDGTPIAPLLTDKRIFVAIPPGENELKLFWQGIQPALETQGLSFNRADRTLPDDVALCELCQELYCCRLAIFDITGQAANVMFALGLAYGIGKPVIILQQQEAAPLGEINSAGYVRYSGATDLKASLSGLLPVLLKN